MLTKWISLQKVAEKDKVIVLLDLVLSRPWHYNIPLARGRQFGIRLLENRTTRSEHMRLHKIWGKLNTYQLCNIRLGPQNRTM